MSNQLRFTRSRVGGLAAAITGSGQLTQQPIHVDSPQVDASSSKAAYPPPPCHEALRAQHRQYALTPHQPAAARSPSPDGSSPPAERIRIVLTTARAWQ